MKSETSKKLGLAGKVLVMGLLASGIATCISNYRTQQENMIKGANEIYQIMSDPHKYFNYKLD
jgi:hypothetical protein